MCCNTYWRTRTGELVEIHNMTDSHLKAALRVLSTRVIQSELLEDFVPERCMLIDAEELLVAELWRRKGA